MLSKYLSHSEILDQFHIYTPGKPPELLESYGQNVLPRTAFRLLEIGISAGQSLRMWHGLYPFATIYGYDWWLCPEAEPLLKEPPYHLFIGDQANRIDLASFITFSGGAFDVIIDDGGHVMRQQQVSFGYLFPHLRPGGVYVIEDIHTSNVTDENRRLYGVQTKAENTTKTFFRQLRDFGVASSFYLFPEECDYISRTVERIAFSADQSSLIAVWKKENA